MDVLKNVRERNRVLDALENSGVYQGLSFQRRQDIFDYVCGANFSLEKLERDSDYFSDFRS